jgi:uncharacterized membrane protein
MSATYAPSPWPAPHGAPAHRPVLGRALEGGEVGMQWLLKPNCSLAPRQLAAVYLSLCVVAALIGGAFYLQGAPWVAAFAGIELLALGAALLVFARHAGDREILTLGAGRLHVQRRHGRHTDEHELPLAWLTVEPVAGQGSLVQLRGRGQQVRVGRHLRPQDRATLALELRQAQRRALGPRWPQENTN